MGLGGLILSSAFLGQGPSNPVGILLNIPSQTKGLPIGAATNLHKHPPRWPRVPLDTWGLKCPHSKNFQAGSI